jgi:carboxymethylenebutenolidase
VLHEAFGLTGDIRAHADRHAREGYVALAPDLFSWGATLRCLVASMRAVMRGEGRAFSDIEAARTFLAGHDRCDGRVGVIGFCMGGGSGSSFRPGGCRRARRAWACSPQSPPR